MKALKDALTSTLALIPLDYSPIVGKVILIVDLSITRFGSVLIQLNDSNKRHPYRYKSGL